MAARILIVDDEKDMLALLQRIISDEINLESITESDALKALELFKENPFDLVITDFKMPKLDGIKLLEELKRIRPDVSVILMTAYATIETAVEAIQKGAFDYITKPFRRERILLTVKKALNWNEIVRENSELRKALKEKEGFFSLIGTAPVMKDTFNHIRHVAPTSASVLITGESGTGKELAARAIYQNSLRKTKKFVTINSAAIPENVIESELFGHVKGAFTGAWRDKTGLVELADEGTLFLDEIGDLSLSLQTKLLRLIQEGEYKPVGSEITRKADIRFVAATNHDLLKDIEERKFREDLYYRLNVVHIKMPSLKERRPDIPLLCHHFLRKYSLLNKKESHGISPQAMQFLMEREYPGNVRELENTIERGVIYSSNGILNLCDLSQDTTPVNTLLKMGSDIFDLPFKEAKDHIVQRFHKQYIQSILNCSGGNISKAADKAGIKRQYLHRLIKETETFGG